LRCLSRNIYSLRGKFKIKLFLVGDESINDFKGVVRGFNIETEFYVYDWAEEKNYENKAQLIIAQMRTKAFDSARIWGADYCWSLDSDVIPPENALNCSIQMLDFDDGYYSIACCPYPSQGGGGFLTGHGSETNHINSDFSIEEREVGEEMSEKLKKIDELIESEPQKIEHRESRAELINKIEKECEPKFGGNIWKIIAEFGWRRRGWFDFAYPAVGKVAVVPVEWTGFGATLMNKKAWACADFIGYDGNGTEDLYIVWKRWYRNNLRLCSIPHCPCGHVIRHGKDKKIVYVEAFHEQEGEHKDHLRKEFRPFYQHSVGERYVETEDSPKK